MRNLISHMLEFLVVLLISVPFVSPQTAHAQDHVVPSSDLQKDLTDASAAREKNQSQLNEFISSPEAQRALKTAHIDEKQVKNAIPQLTDDELAQLAAKSEQAEKDFVAGRMSDRDLIIILIGIVALILIIVAVR